jgi:signal transduction histidine kinase
MDLRAIDGLVASVISGGRRVQFETRHRRKDGTVQDVEVSAVPFDLDGRPLIFCLTRNIGRRKQAQAEQEAARQDLERQVELRTPLNAVLGYAQLLASAPEGDLAPRQREQVRQIGASADHLLALVNDLLDLARIETGELEVDIRPVDMLEVGRRAWASVEPMAAREGVDVVVGARVGGGALGPGRRGAHPAMPDQPGLQRHQVQPSRRQGPHRAAP